MNFKVFFITKDERSQKVLKLNNLLEFLPLEIKSCFNFIEIVNSLEDFDLKLNPVGVLNDVFMRLNPSSIPKYLTHYSIYKKVLKEEIDFCIIVEDEVDLSDLINLLLINPDYPDWAEIINLSSSGIKSLNAYAITKHGAEHLLQLLFNTKWLNSVKRFGPSDYDLPASFLLKSLALSTEGLQDFSLTNSIVAPIEKLILLMCQHQKVKSHHKISFINKNKDYNTFPIANDLSDITDIDLSSFKESKAEEHIIDHIFYINLDQDTDKRERVNSMLYELGINFERYPAIKPEQKDIEAEGQYQEVFSKSKILEARNYFGEKFDHLNIQKYQLGTLGCYLSHYKLLEHIYNNYSSLEHVIVLEDDAFLDQSTIEMLSKTIKKIDEWDIIRSTWSAPDQVELIKYCHPLSNNYEHSMQAEIYKKIRSFQKQYPSVCPIIHAFCGGTHFQAINVSSIPKILSYLDSEVLLPIDSLYNTDKLKIYNKKLNVSHDIFSKSSIQVKSND